MLGEESNFQGFFFQKLGIILFEDSCILEARLPIQINPRHKNYSRK